MAKLYKTNEKKDLNKLTITTNPLKRNEMHLNAQINLKANVFVDRKKRAKNGYSKHKSKDYLD